MHPLLLLITLVLLATSTLSIEPSNPAKLRSERILKSQGTFTCSSNTYCTQEITFKGRKATYSILLQPESQLGLQVTPEDEKELIISLEGDAPALIVLYAYSPQDQEDQGYTHPYEQDILLSQPTTTAKTTVSGPVGTVVIFFNSYGTEADITLTITRSGQTPVWVIAFSASIGVLIVVIVVVFCYYRRKRRNRQRRCGQPAQPRQEANTHKTQEIIDMRFPEARFEQFESSFPQKTCTICLEDMQKEQICRQLDCQHIFHTECGKQWLENQFEKMKKVFCPNCNKQVNILNPKKGPKAKKRRA